MQSIVHKGGPNLGYPHIAEIWDMTGHFNLQKTGKVPKTKINKWSTKKRIDLLKDNEMWSN